MQSPPLPSDDSPAPATPLYANQPYQEEEKRSFVRLNLLTLAFTFGALLIAIVLITAIGVLPAALTYLWLDLWQELLALSAFWPFILLFIGCGITVIYRYGSRFNDGVAKANGGVAHLLPTRLARALTESDNPDHARRSTTPDDLTDARRRSGLETYNCNDAKCRGPTMPPDSNLPETGSAKLATQAR